MPPRIATTVDAGVALVGCGLTGGSASLLVAVLPAEAVMDAAGVAPARRRSHVEPAGAAVRCDPQRLRRVLTDLVENAARHSGEAPNSPGPRSELAGPKV